MVPGSCSQNSSRSLPETSGLVADADELRDADVQLRRGLEDREPQRAALRRERHAAAGGIRRRERGVQAHRALGVEHAQAVGPDQAHAVAARDREQLALRARRPRRPVSLKPALITIAALHALACRTPRPRRATCAAGTTMTASSTGLGHLRDAGVRAHRLHHLRLGVHRVDGALETMLEKVVEDLGADRAALARGADHRHAARPKDRLEPFGSAAQATPLARMCVLTCRSALAAGPFQTRSAGPAAGTRSAARESRPRSGPSRPRPRRPTERDCRARA